jgi:hypothetical protein
MSKRYNICVARPKKDGGVWWHKIGTGFEGDKGITVFLDSLPVPDAEGKVKLSIFEHRDEQQGAAQAGAGKETAPAGRRMVDDDIPW